jgi:FkbM family methyltransferase
MLQIISGIAQSHPLLWRGAWSVLHHLKPLLPHDISYKGVKLLGLTSSKLILDVGANDGISALSFRKLLPDSPILSIEVSPRHENSLRRLKLRMKKFDYAIVGAGGESSKETLFTPAYRGILLHTFAGMDELRVRTALTESYGERISARCTMLNDTISIEPLDSLNVDPEFIKIDVEGMAIGVLRGLRETIERCRPKLMVEVEQDQIEETLDFTKKYNYAATMYDAASNELVPIRDFTDFFASKNKNVFFVPSRNGARI